MKRTKTLSAMSFSAYDVERRTRKSSFMHKSIPLSIGNPFLLSSTNTIKKDFPPRVKNPYDELLLFKMLLIGMWNTIIGIGKIWSKKVRS
nr:hypothetical protein [Capnocytophaga canimorsus]